MNCEAIHKREIQEPQVLEGKSKPTEGGTAMNMVDIILKKKAGGELNEEEIRFFARGAADGSIPDYQLSALLMAI